MSKIGHWGWAQGRKPKYFLMAKTSRSLENTGGKPLNIVRLTTICNFEPLMLESGHIKELHVNQSVGRFMC